MDNIRDTYTLETLEKLSDNKTITYSILAFMPAMVKNKECTNGILVHQRKVVLTTTDIQIAKDVFKEFEQFYPSIQATIIFD